jgi:hypothetical protein
MFKKFDEIVNKRIKLGVIPRKLYMQYHLYSIFPHSLQQGGLIYLIINLNIYLIIMMYNSLINY